MATKSVRVDIICKDGHTSYAEYVDAFAAVAATMTAIRSVNVESVKLTKVKASKR